MGYLNNNTVTIDAVLTKKGRELLARGDGSFKITQFALADDEINYKLFNSDNEQGSDFYGQAIEDLPMLEAFVDEQQIMKYKLITLERGTTTIPSLSGVSSTTLQRGVSTSIIPKTLRFRGVNEVQETRGYILTVSDVRLLSQFTATGIQTDAAQELSQRTSFGTNVSKSLIGTSFTLTATQVGTDKLTGTITVEGRDSGARTTVTLTIE